MPATPVFSSTCTPILVSRRSTLSDSFSGRMGTVRPRASTSNMDTSAGSISNFSHSEGTSSASSPAISTPVKPAPTT